jgi:CSLREA domain-containing protein
MTQKQLSSDFRSSPTRLVAVLGVLALLLALTGVLGPARTVHAAGPFTVNTTADTHDASAGDGICLDGNGNCSLRAAIEQATASGGATTINLPPGTYNLSLGELQTGSAAGTNITLTGTSTPADTFINQSDNTHRIFNIDFLLHGSITVSISHVTIENGVGGAGGGGGGILDGDTGDVLNLMDVVFNGNRASTFDGGAISFTGGGTLNVQSSTFSNNTAPFGNGGAIQFFQTQPGSFTVANSTFVGNSATGGPLGGQGGAINVICNLCSPFSITNSIFIGNTAVQVGSAGGQGGAIMAGAGTLSLNFNRIVGNTAAGGGSGLYNGGATLDAINNWWGCNAGPGAAGCDTAASGGSGSLTTSPRIVLALTANPAAILVGQSSNLTASFLQNSANQVLTSGDVSAMTGDPVSWNTNATFGSLAGQQFVIHVGGTATAAFFSNGVAGASSTSVTVNNQTVTLTLNVNEPPAITSLASATFVVGTAGSFTVTTTGFPAPALSETGTLPSGVGFTDNGNGTATLSGPPGPGTVGNYPITITAANGIGSNATQDFTLTVSKAATTTALVSASNPSVLGQSVTFTATVTTTAPSAGIPTGTVTFLDGASSIGTGTLNGSGVATLTTSALSIGTHSLTAQYGGDTNFLTSTSSAVSQVVNQAGTTTALVSALNPSVFGQSVTFTATVVVTAPGTGAPAGTVTFFDGATNLGIASLNGSGVATLTTAALTGGTHSLTAVYSGDASFNGSTSAPLSQVVNPAGTTITLAFTMSIFRFGLPVTFTATVTAIAPGGGTPTGSVTFRDGATVLGTVPLNASGVAALSTSTIARGAHSITVDYTPGTGNYNASTLTQSVLVPFQYLFILIFK